MPRKSLEKGAMIDPVPGIPRLYIGGLIALLKLRKKLKDLNVTHVLSVLDIKPDPSLNPMTQYVIGAIDVPSYNLIRHFPTCSRFIEEALKTGGSVFVHCAVGKSRSATCILAYMMQHLKIDPDDALAQLRTSRPMVEPNEGFSDQLKLYHEMGCPSEVTNDPTYQRWVWRKELIRSGKAGTVPDHIYFGDEHPEAPAQAPTGRPSLRCRSCRRILALPRDFAAHEPPEPSDTGEGRKGKDESTACAHYFVEPLTWMREELEMGKLEGRLCCPKCRSNVGRYAWQGMQCNCGTWQTPSISFSRSKIDSIATRPP